jgi:hypothetical protein
MYTYLCLLPPSVPDDAGTDDSEMLHSNSISKQPMPKMISMQLTAAKT